MLFNDILHYNNYIIITLQLSSYLVEHDQHWIFLSNDIIMEITIVKIAVFQQFNKLVVPYPSSCTPVILGYTC